MHAGSSFVTSAHWDDVPVGAFCGSPAHWDDVPVGKHAQNDARKRVEKKK